MEIAKRRIVLLVLFIIRSQSVESVCNLITEREGVLCHGRLICSGDFEQAGTEVRNWRCRRHEYYDNYDYYREHPRVRISDDYTLSVHAEKIDEPSFEGLTEITEFSDHILSISVINGNFSSVPLEIMNLRNAQIIDLSRNSIENLNLETFSRESLSILNVSFNVLSNLGNAGISIETGLGELVTLDLSNNVIQVIPNNCFRLFPKLQHLNLSHNSIESIDILTFEGIAQLRTLYISDNKLSNLGQYFARFVNLKELLLDNNHLISIEINNFNKMSSLETLNLSCNYLMSINDSSFDKLFDLEKLDMSSNKLSKISKSWFSHNSNLTIVDISNNVISRIEPGAFEGKSITEFKIQNNNITGRLEKYTFRGIGVQELDLSRAYISELASDVFDETNANLQFLNLSHNSISKIHKTAFSKLELLNTLDLSHNKLQEIEFEMTNLRNLTTLYINDNAIKKITRNIFKTVTSLKTIQLSNNDIHEIDILSFENLSELESLVFNNNPLPAVIDSQTFSGLTACTTLDLTYTKINALHNNSFFGMNSLAILNISYSALKVLEFEVFNGTGVIKSLDISHNQIELFFINNSKIKLVTSINLGYNKLQHITDKTFSGLNKLMILNLDHNHIVNVETAAFRTLDNLVSLRLGDNTHITFNSSLFYNMTSLHILYLNNVLTPFDFQNAVNTSITGLDISSCGISDIYAVLMYQMKTIERLKLSSNKIRSIDKFSFDKLEHLTWVDLSYNLITNIQPSSFSHCGNLEILKLNNNFLSSLRFGVFDGLSNLEILDLSNNTLHILRANIFHSAPRLKIVYIDNNLIDNINLNEFRTANIRKLSIGGNTIPCYDLTELKKHDYPEFTVTTKERKYDTENVNGITCRSSAKFENTSRVHANDTVLTAALLNTIEEFKVTVERILNRNESNVGLDSTSFQNISKTFERLQDSSNKSDTRKIFLLDRLLSISNSTNWYLTDILDIMKKRVLPNAFNYSEPNISIKDENIKNTVNEMFQTQRDSLKSEFQSMFDEWMSRNVLETNHFKPLTSDNSGSKDVNSVLYFIAFCIAVLLCVMVLIFILFYFKLRPKRAHDDLYSSRQPIQNVMEME